MRLPALLLIGLSCFASACGSNAVAPTAPSNTVVSASTEVFAGTLSAAGTAFYSFTSLGTDTVNVTFGSLTSVATGLPLATPMKIGLGIPSGTGCGLLTSKVVSPALTAQIVGQLAPGKFCVSITDAGGLAADSNFAVRITQGILTLKAGTSPETFSSNLAVKGASTRTFVVTTGGSVTASLDSVSPSTVVGFGIGLWRAELSVCSLFSAVTAGPGAQVSATVDQGIYCVRVFDVGNLTDFASFSSTVIHP